MWLFRSILPSSLSGLVVLALGAGGEGQKQESVFSRVFTDAAERRKAIGTYFYGKHPGSKRLVFTMSM